VVCYEIGKLTEKYNALRASFRSRIRRERNLLAFNRPEFLEMSRYLGMTIQVTAQLVSIFIIEILIRTHINVRFLVKP